MNKLFTQLVEKRHLDESFLHPKYQNLIPASSMPDMDKTITRIKQALDNHEKILIYGDYDVDGVTASTVMEDALTFAGARPEDISVMLPDRFLDGYGMSPRLVTRATETGVGLVITVDCGSRNHAIIAELNEHHIDTIVTDHHECEDTLPEAVAVVNPKRKDFTGPAALREMAGVGMAFKVAQGLVDAGLIKKGQEKWLLDLVLIGTICDSMLLTGENRIFGFYGIKVLEKTRRPGLKELMRNAGITKVTSESIGYQIGPRLNAAGRLETAEISLNLLRTKSVAEAASLAAELEILNKKRRDEQRAATDEIAARGLTEGSVIIETGKWHEGILGIVAGRLVEKYHKPVFVLSEVENNIYKGSGRSFGDFSLAEALNYTKDSIISGGGHAGAAGVRIDGAKLYEFREKINAYYDSLHLTDQEKYLRSSADLATDDIGDFTLELMEEMALLEPFGPGNEEPIFRICGAEIVEARRLGADGKHLRLDIKGRDGKIIKCVAFYAPEKWFNLYPDDVYDVLIQPTINEFRGTRSVEARLIDIISQE
ncbi:single-stranded-DNA-specific exonuclease RecJ [Candidatus Saccharibacteria bacterium]|nr:single-stranded-DNA-specific exonuclease RecJ [Candidatus Saccharibacteria bacterium]